jgi:hypothetical protein
MPAFRWISIQRRFFNGQFEKQIHSMLLSAQDFTITEEPGAGAMGCSTHPHIRRDAQAHPVAVRVRHRFQHPQTE